MGVLIREIGNRHGLDPVYGHEVVMADGTAITVAGRLILAPRRIGNDGTEKRQLRNVFRYALGFRRSSFNLMFRHILANPFKMFCNMFLAPFNHGS